MSQLPVLVVHDNQEFGQPIRYTFGLLMGILGLRGHIHWAKEEWDSDADSVALIISYGEHPVAAVGRKQIHISASELFGHDYLTPASLPAEPLPRLGDLPIVYKGKRRIPGHVSSSLDLVQTDADIVASSFFMATRYEEVVGETQPDEHGRFPAQASLAHRESFLHRPLVHEYAELLWSWITDLVPELARNRPWGNHGFAACMTHDIDALRRYGCPPVVTVAKAFGARDVPRAIGIVAEYGRVTTGRQEEPYDTFDFMVERERAQGLVPTFYFMAGSRGRKGSQYQDYEIDDRPVVETMHRLECMGCEIGLHPSYDAFGDLHLLREEKARLEQVLGHPIAGMRQHYLRFAAPQSWHTCEQAGFAYDSTLSYSKEAGFRAGICVPYRPFDLLENRELSLWEVPLTVMEGTLLEWQGLDASEAGPRFEQLIDTVAQYGGAFVVLWHNSFLDELVYPGVRSAYERLVQGLGERSPLGVSVAQAVEIYQRWMDDDS